MEKKKLGQRQTKLAYVETTPRPPLNVLRAQDRNRRAAQPQTASTTTKTRVAQAGRPSGAKFAASAPASNPSSKRKKTKPAPLMAKALKMAKKY